jgi:hypothetical protein
MPFMYVSHALYILHIFLEKQTMTIIYHFYVSWESVFDHKNKMTFYTRKEKESVLVLNSWIVLEEKVLSWSINTIAEGNRNN